MSVSPLGWATSNLDEIGEIFCGQSVSEAEVNRVERGALYVTGPEQWNGRHIERNKWTEAPKRLVPEGCIFITVKGAGVGKTFPGAAAAIGRDIYAYKPSSNVDAEFVHRAIRYRIAGLIAEARGDIPGLSRGHLAGHTVPLPPLAEQRRIVTKLDALTARLARARAELERVETLNKRNRHAILSALFRNFDAAPRDLLGDLCRVGTGATPKRGEPRYYDGGNIPWVTSGAVNNLVIATPTEMITEAALSETNCKVYPAGTLLLALYGEGRTRGKVATLGIAAATNQALAALSAFDHERVSPNWVRLFLESRYEQTREQAAGGVQPNLNLGVVKTIQLPVPPMSEQLQAVRKIETAFARADRLEAEAARAKKLLDRLEAAILAKAFRGELVPQDPADEPASVLLDRIRAERAAAPKRKGTRRSRSASVYTE